MLVASELRYEAKDALLLRAAPVDEAYLRRSLPERFVQQDLVQWDADKRALVARRQSSFDRIVLDSRPAGRIDPAHAAAALTDAVRQLGLDALPWTDTLQQWRSRVQSLRVWMPELALPDLSDTALLETLDSWLRPAFAGKTRLDALDEASLGEALKPHCRGSAARPSTATPPPASACHREWNGRSATPSTTPANRCRQCWRSNCRNCSAWQRPHASPTTVSC